MEAKTIERVNLKNIGLKLTRHRTDLLEEAGKLLGYKSTTEGRLVRALLKLDIRPLNTVSVATYKKSKAIANKWVKLPNGSEERLTRTWKMVDLAAYEGLVPDHVLMKAVAIKKALPSVAFQVEALMEKKEFRRRTVRLPDPFLIAVLPGAKTERVYIDVWDEPDYEKKLYA